MSQLVDREVIINGVSYHERWYRGELVFRQVHLFEPRKHPRWDEIRRLIRGRVG